MFEQYDGDGLSSMGFAATDVAELTKADPEHWVRFKLDEQGSCEGLRCTAHFTDGSAALLRAA
ncbi:hypothetical protein [Burkholderia ubonensis]|uniref:hypothetical protein n=1 Tax=Burkholderia ubonensis TaxID=101571 RepID=UPI000A70985B|nr:hypothetical protein [Burkholderia ubonensis]